MKLVVPPQVDVVDNLGDDSDIKALAASQGKALDEAKVDTASIVDSLDSNNANVPLSANQGKALGDRLDDAESRLKDTNGDFVNPVTNSDGGLVQLTADGKLPVLDGSNLINVSSSATERFSLAAVNEVNTTYSPSLGSTYSLHSNNSMTVSFGNLSGVQVLAGNFGVTVAADNRSSDSNGNGQIFIFDRPMYVHYSVHLNWISTGTPDNSYLYIDVSYNGGVDWESRHSTVASRKYVGANGFGTTTSSGSYWIEINDGDEHVSRSGTVFFEAGYAIRVRVGYINDEATFDSVRLSLLEV